MIEVAEFYCRWLKILPTCVLAPCKLQTQTFLIFHYLRWQRNLRQGQSVNCSGLHCTALKCLKETPLDSEFELFLNQTLLASALHCASIMVEGQVPINIASNLGLSVFIAVVAPQELVGGFTTQVSVQGIISPGTVGPAQQGIAIAVVTVNPSLSSWVIGTKNLENLQDYKSSIVAVGLSPFLYMHRR